MSNPDEGLDDLEFAGAFRDLDETPRSAFLADEIAPRCALSAALGAP
jgi:hypothetical protein